MSYLDSEIVKDVKEYATAILNGLNEDFAYHNLQHTQEVVEAAIEIGENSGLEEKELETLVIAAWLHDIGYSCNCEDHEEESIRMMETRLKELKLPIERISQVADIIRATKMPQSPQDLVAKVMCDADLYHLGSTNFDQKNIALREELKKVRNNDIPESDWKRMNIEFLSKHNYFTPYAEAQFAKGKKKNIKRLKGSIKKEEKEFDNLEKEIIKLKSKLEKAKVQKPDRGIETMFRITSENHVTLSGMADNKANIMISINSIILSILVSVLFRKIEEYPNLLIPGIILTAVCLSTIVFAVLATRPTVPSGKFSKEDIYKRKTNLLFFGNFHKMELENYMWGMKEMMKDADFLYGSMIKDIYFLGKVLGRKYKLLRIAYTIFMFGFVIAILAFITAMVLYPAGSYPGSF